MAPIFGSSPISPLTPIASRPRVERAVLISEGSTWVFTFGLLIFLATLVASGGLFIYVRSLEASKLEWEDQVRAKESELRPDLLDQLTDFARLISASQDLLKNHVFASNTLLFLEKATHQKVSFTTYGFNHEHLRVDMQGSAGSYRVVAEQVTALEANFEVEKVEFGGMAMNEKGVVTFKLSIIFKPTILQYGK